MPVKIACPKCSKNYTLPDSALGKAVKCKACGMTFRTRKSAQPAPPSQTATRPTQPAARPTSQAARPTSQSARPTRPALAKPSQPVAPDLNQFGVEGGFQQQPDIFGAPPSPRGGAGLGNFAEEGFGEAVAPVVLGREGAQEVQENPYQSVLTNTAIKKGGAKSGGRKRKRGSSASFDPERYSVARIGMMIVLGSLAIVLMTSVFSTVINILARLMPSTVETLGVVFGIVGLIMGILCIIAFIAFFVGQLICAFAPESNEKINAGGSLGLFCLSMFGGFVGVLVMGFSAVNMFRSNQLGGGPSQAEAAALGIGMLVILVICGLLGLVSVVLFANYYRVIGKNIKSKELISAGNQGLAGIGIGVGGQVLLFLAAFLIGYLGVDVDTAGVLGIALMVLYWLLGFVVYALLLRMVMVGVRVLKE